MKDDNQKKGTTINFNTVNQTGNNIGVQNNYGRPQRGPERLRLRLKEKTRHAKRVAVSENNPDCCARRRVLR
jgi:hypothetical protein